MADISGLLDKSSRVSCNLSVVHVLENHRRLAGGNGRRRAFPRRTAIPLFIVDCWQ